MAEDVEADTGPGWPSRMDMIRQVRAAAGLFDGAMPISPRQAWEEALTHIQTLAGTAPPLEHNHITRDIKREGECPACDQYHAKTKGC